MTKEQRVQEKSSGRKGSVLGVSGTWGHVVEVAWDDGSKSKVTEGELIQEPTRVGVPVEVQE
jgi:hypothetical protein